MRTPVSVGVVASGRWGNRIACTFAALDQVDLRWICAEPGPVARAWAAPAVRHARSIADLLADESLDAIALAVPLSMRGDLALAALAADKHVYLVGAPAQSGAAIAELLRTARSRNRRLAIAQPALLEPSLRKLATLMDEGRLGDVFYVYGVRHVTGTTDADDTLLWNEGAADIALALHLLGDEPVEVDARGECYLDSRAPDLLECHLRFATGITARFHLSALDAEPCARLSIIGSSCTAVLDATPSRRSLTLFSAETDVQPSRRLEGFAPGDMFSPHVPPGDPWLQSCADFVIGVRSSAVVPDDEYRAGTVLVEVLEALEQSLAGGGSVRLPAADPHSDLHLVELPGR